MSSSQKHAASAHRSAPWVREPVEYGEHKLLFKLKQDLEEPTARRE
jgi:hypothetical protein